MRFYLLDDDKNILKILEMIIEKRNLGVVCGKNIDAKEAIYEVTDLKPDIIIVDLLMDTMDGISFVKKAKHINNDFSFIMLSQVSSKDMIASAYESGIEFFIQKPLNSVEIETIIRKVSHNISINKTFNKMQSLFQNEVNPMISVKENNVTEDRKHVLKVKNILHKLGILGELGSKDIISMVDYLIMNNEDLSNLTLDELCLKFNNNPKSIEQRMRRAATSGMINLANLGIEDYSNDIFNEYSNTLYNFEQVKREMDYIRGKGNKRGKVFIKNFLNALVAYSKD